MTVLLGGLLLLGFRLVAGRQPRLHLTPGERRAFWWLLGGLVLANWAYLIVWVG